MSKTPFARRRLVGFIDRRSGEWREILNPDGEPTGRQLCHLNRAGALDLVPPGQAEPLTKATAAGAIDDAEQGAEAGKEHDNRPRVRIHVPPRFNDKASQEPTA